MTCLPHATLPVPFVVLLWRPMTSSSRHTEWHGKTLRTKQQAQNLFSTWKKHRGPSAQASMFISWQKLHSYPPPKKKKSYWIPTPVSFIWKWLTCSAFFESFWLQYLETPLFQELNSICQTCLFTQNQVLFASFHSCTKHTNPPISAGKKGVWGQLFIKQRHFYFIVNTHPGAVVSVTTNSHCKKLLHWKDK